MAAAPKLAPEQWEQVRRAWETDERASFEFLVRELSLPISAAAIRKKAKSEGWTKKGESSTDAASRAGLRAPPHRTENSKNKGRPDARKYKRDGGRSSADDGGAKGGEGSPPKVPKGRKASNRRFKKSEGNGSGESQAQGSEHGSDQGSNLEDETMNSFSQWKGCMEIDLQRDPFGRPPKFEFSYIEQAFQLALLGLTDERIAPVFNVDVRTIYRWKNEYPDFCQALSRGKTIADAEVAFGLFERARGMALPKVVITAYKGEITKTNIFEYYPPDVGAASLWLRNRHPDLWRAEPEPPPPDPSAGMVSQSVLDTIYAESMASSTKRAAVARGRRERLGLFVGDGDGIDDEVIAQARAQSMAQDRQPGEWDGGLDDEGEDG